MKRRLLNLLTALSLLLCLAVSALWVRSHFDSVAIACRRGTNNYGIHLAGGQLDLSVTDESPLRMEPQGWWWNS